MLNAAEMNCIAESSYSRASMHDSILKVYMVALYV